MMDYPVFIIDDDDAMRDSLLTMLRAQGITARGFSSGADFFNRLPDVETACVITDIRMPYMDGAEVVRRLAAQTSRSWPVIVITGHAEVPMAVEMMKAGVVDFIEKPFDPVRLIETLRGCLGLLTDQQAQRDLTRLSQERLELLTNRERQVFEMLINGLSNKQIAIELEISSRTVEIFRAKVMAKMQADSLSALVRMGLTVRSQV